MFAQYECCGLQNNRSNDGNTIPETPRKDGIVGTEFETILKVFATISL